MLIAMTLTTVDIMASGAIGKKHTEPGKDGAKVNCGYCHQQAGVAKEKGSGASKNSNAYCSACHK